MCDHTCSHVAVVVVHVWRQWNSEDEDFLEKRLWSSCISCEHMKLKCHVYVRICQWHHIHQLVLNHLKALKALISIQSRLSWNQLASWVCWGHRCQQIFVESEKYGVYQCFWLFMLDSYNICPLANCWSIFGVKWSIIDQNNSIITKMFEHKSIA